MADELKNLDFEISSGVLSWHFASKSGKKICELDFSILIFLYIFWVSYFKQNSNRGPTRYSLKHKEQK